MSQYQTSKFPEIKFGRLGEIENWEEIHKWLCFNSVIFNHCLSMKCQSNLTELETLRIAVAHFAKQYEIIFLREMEREMKVKIL